MYIPKWHNRVVRHSTIITNVDENDIYYSAHSGPRNDEKLSNGHLVDEMVFIIRIRDDAVKGYTDLGDYVLMKKKTLIIFCFIGLFIIIYQTFQFIMIKSVENVKNDYFDVVKGKKKKKLTMVH